MGKFKKITSSILLLVFLMLSVVKLEHRYDHFLCKAENEKHYHDLHRECSVCNSEFPVFLKSAENFHSVKEIPSDAYRNNYSTRNNFNPDEFSFLLRAPPFRQI